MALAATFQNLTKELTELNLESRRMQTFSFTLLAIAAFMGISRLVRIPILIQMLTYSLPIIWLGSHLSLDMRVIAQEQSDKTVSGEVLSGKDAALFPILASATIFSLYLAFKLLPEYWVNLVLSIHIVMAGWWSIQQTIRSVVLLGFPHLSEGGKQICISPLWPCSKKLSVSFELSKLNVLATVLAGCVAIGWFVSRAWVLHNLFAIGFSIQAIHLMSVGNFKTASVLLIGLFFYDIFWVFGTEVMVKVAKTFDAPAKLLFPVGKPGEYSLLGLGDIVIPGIFVAMTLRFDYWLHDQRAKEKRVDIDTSRKPMFRTFSKFYFTSSMIAYAVSLLVTGVVMLVFKSAQPALLYLVPAILVALYVPAIFRGELRKVIEFTEEPEEEEGEDESSSSGSDSE